MKKFSGILVKKYNIVNMLASIALIVSTFVATRHCVFIYHQGEIPEKLDLLRNL